MHARNGISFVVLLFVTLMLVANFALVSGAQTSPATAPSKQVSVLLVVDASVPLSVNYISTGRLWRSAILNGLLAPAPVLVEAGISSSEHANENKKLREAAGSFNRRAVAIEPIVSASFNANQYFHCQAASNPSTYLVSKKEVNLDKAKADGYPFLLYIREDFAGLMTIWELSTVTTATYLHYELWDTASHQLLSTDTLSGFNKAKRPLDEALKNKFTFLAEYPYVVGSASTRMLFDFYDLGVMHRMADAVGLGNEVPDENAILKKYADKFDYNFHLPQGWHAEQLESKYQQAILPAGDDKNQVGMVFQIELLTDEMGEKASTVEEYAALVFTRLRSKGFVIEDAQQVDSFNLDKRYLAFLLDRPNSGGKEIFVFRKLDDRFAAMYQVYFTADMDNWMKKYGKDFETVIKTTEITTRS